MWKYILKRIGYMLLVLVILSFLMYFIYNLTPSNRAYTDARTQVTANKNMLATMTTEEQNEYFDKVYLDYQRRYGTDTDNIVLRYLRWVGIAPNYYGEFNGLLQGNLGYSQEYKKPVIDVIKEPMKNTIFINIFATILGPALPSRLAFSAPCARTAASTRARRSSPSSATVCRPSSFPFCSSGSSARFSGFSPSAA